MVLIPLMQYIFDTTWPVADSATFMTAARVWGPLSIGLIVWLVLSVWWVALIGLALTGIMLWVDPKFYEKIEWEDYETKRNKYVWVKPNGR